jgi:hypothetical protein
MDQPFSTRQTEVHLMEAATSVRAVAHGVLEVTGRLAYHPVSNVQWPKNVEVDCLDTERGGFVIRLTSWPLDKNAKLLTVRYSFNPEDVPSGDEEEECDEG